MKINNDYPVVSSRHNHANPNIDYLLYGSVEGIDENEMQFLGERKGKFRVGLPRRTISFKTRVTYRHTPTISASLSMLTKSRA